MSHIRAHRAQWIAMLAKLTSPMESTAAAQAFNAFLPMLADFPDAAFTPASLDHVASKCRGGVPNYADIRSHIADWWKRNRPPLPELPPPDPLPKPRTKEELDWAERTSLKAQREVARIAAQNHAAFVAAYGRPPDTPLKALHLTPWQLVEAYRQAGITRPNLPTLPEPLRAAAAEIRTETRKGPVVP